MSAGQIPVRQVAADGTAGQVATISPDGLLVEWADQAGATAAALAPTATLTATKSSGNPTLTETGSMPENLVRVGDTYWLLYSRRATTPSSYTRLHLASSTSPAGPWTPYGGNPVLTLGSQAWEAANISNGGCLLEHEGVFYIFYGDGSGSGDEIGVATATTVTGPYTKYASNPILSPGASGAWDSLRVAEPSVAVVDGVWTMAYMAETSASGVGTTEKVGIATASSPFGPWTKDAANPVIGFGAAGAFDQGGAADPSLWFENGRWWCLYSGLNTSGGKPWQIGLAYADTPSGPWTRHAQNPIIPNGAAGAFDEKAAWRGALYREGSTYYIPYGGIPASAQSYDAKGGTVLLTVTGGSDPLAAHETDADPHPQYVTRTEADARYLDQTEGDARYVRTVNGTAPDGTGNVTVTAGPSTTALVPMVSQIGTGDPGLVWTDDGELLLVEVPL